MDYLIKIHFITIGYALFFLLSYAIIFRCEVHKLYNVLFEDDGAFVKFNEILNSSSILFDDSYDDDDDERVGRDESNCLSLDNRALRERAALLLLWDIRPFVAGISSLFFR